MFSLIKKNRKNDSINEAESVTLSERLKRTRTGLFGDLFKRTKNIDAATLEQLEERMIQADIGLQTTEQLIQLLKADADNDPNSTPLTQLKQTLLAILKPVEQPLIIPAGQNKPFLILVVGVNGVGKTTTIGKLSKRLSNQGKQVMLAAGDTYRAAAIEQLQVWGSRHQLKVIAQSDGADPAAVIYDGLVSARANNADVLIADTAGRLHNKDHLMAEMKKIHRIGKKFDAGLKQEVLLVLDAGTGQNALIQTKQFHECIGVDGIVLTKLDGTAKGGIVFSLANELGIPIRFIGIGEQTEDLRPFIANDFIDALLTPEL